jgi:hypothetical protein
MRIHKNEERVYDKDNTNNIKIPKYFDFSRVCKKF